VTKKIENFAGGLAQSVEGQLWCRQAVRRSAVIAVINLD